MDELRHDERLKLSFSHQVLGSVSLQPDHALHCFLLLEPLGDA